MLKYLIEGVDAMNKKLTKPTRNKTSRVCLSVPPEKTKELREKVKEIAVALLTEELKKRRPNAGGITVLDIVNLSIKEVEVDWFGDDKDYDNTIDVLITRRLPIEEYRKSVDAYYRQQQREKEKLIRNKDKLLKSADKEIETLKKKMIGAEKRREKLQNL